jgi:PAS domain S-box-containing protein
MPVNSPPQEPALRLTPNSETRYRLLFEHSMDGILLTTPDGRIFDANPGACSILGRTREEILSSRREDLVDATDANLARLVEERRRTGKAQGELIARRADGTTFPMEVSSVVFPDREGNEFTCMMIRDISLRRQAEEEREELIDGLQEALSNVKVLSGLLSLCASCKKVHTDDGQWEPLETYIRKRSAAEFSHGLCPECLHRLYPGSLQG